MDYFICGGITPGEFCAIASDHSDRQEARQRARGILAPSIKTDDLISEKFEAKINLNDFAPEEISVKTENSYLVIECKHEERKEKYGIVSRQLLTRYQLPDHLQPANVQKKLSVRGKLTILTVVATKKVLDTEKDEGVTSEAHVGAKKVEAVSIAHAANKEKDVVVEGNYADNEEDKVLEGNDADNEEDKVLEGNDADNEEDKVLEGNDADNEEDVVLIA